MHLAKLHISIMTDTILLKKNEIFSVKLTFSKIVLKELQACHYPDICVAHNTA